MPIAILTFESLQSVTVPLPLHIWVLDLGYVFGCLLSTAEEVAPPIGRDIFSCLNFCLFVASFQGQICKKTKSLILLLGLQRFACSEILPIGFYQ